MITIASLHLYPVKSLRGFSVNVAEIDALGFVGDRRFLVVDETGRFITQRTVPQMAIVATTLSDGFLTLTAEGFGNISVPLAPDPTAPTVAVSVWSDDGLLAEDCGSAVGAWLTNVLTTPCRLVRIGPAFRRPVERGTAHPGDRFSFADGAPLLVTTTASLQELNRRLAATDGAPVTMDRFRPNLVLDGGAPFAEDYWSALDVAGARFRAAGPCSRCLVITADQFTGQRGKEPLKTLTTFRRTVLDSPSVHFGVNLIQESKSGLVRVGDPVVVTCL